jgi:UPF0755 protein
LEEERQIQIKDIVVRAGIVFAFPVIAGLLAYLYLSALFLHAPDAGDTKMVLFEVAPDTTLKKVAYNLEEKGLIKSWWALSVLSRLGGNDKKINAGEYELSRSMSTVDVYRKLISGKTFMRNVTVKEGMTVWQIAEAVEKAGLLPRQDFETSVKDIKMLSVAGIPSESFEGYLFPETYSFSKPITAQQIIWRMLEEGDKHWPPAYTERADTLKFSRHEILTLASIIEKESGSRDEQPIISSVFHNRLKEGMKLQSDPTVIYGIKNFNGDLTKADLEAPTPYNTYTRQGLPVGPISNPGETAIKAALFPADTAYFFFVADGQGGHVFSSTLSEHNANVNRYQRGILEKGAVEKPASNAK